MYIVGEEPVSGIEETEDSGVEMNHWWNLCPRDSRQVIWILYYVVDFAVSDLIFIFFFSFS